MGKKEKKEKKKYLIGMILFSIALVVCVIGMIYMNWKKQQGQKNFEELTDKYVQETEQNTTEKVSETEEETESETVAIPEKEIDWDELKQENEDIYAWIYVPGTQIDYPILQHPKEDDYYLNRNLDGSSGYPGCIFSERCNAKDFTDNNTVLYGHNMKNGTMFGDLHKFEDDTFFEEYRYVYIYTPEGNHAYEIATAGTFSDKHIMYSYDFTNRKDFDSFVEDLSTAEHIHDEVKEKEVYGNRLLTLSTCINGRPNNRWIVTAVEIQ